MPRLRIFLAVGVALSAANLSACTSTGNGVSPELALNTAPVEDEQSADFPLPETVAVLPSSYAPVEGAPIPIVADASAVDPNAVNTGATDAGVAQATLPAPAQPGVPVPTAAPQAVTQVASLDPSIMPAVAYAAPDAGAKAPEEIEPLIQKYAAIYEVPADLVRRVVRRESTYNPLAYSRGHWGLMQIKHSTARGMGYDGPAQGLLDAETNLKYAVKYLRGAWLVAEGDGARADKLYQRGYYYDAKRRGLLDETGLGTDRRRMRGKQEPAPGPQLAAMPVAGWLDFPPVAPGIPTTAPSDFPPAPAAPGATPAATSAVATPAVATPAAATSAVTDPAVVTPVAPAAAEPARSADMPVITPATAPVPTAAPANPAAAGSA